MAEKSKMSDKDEAEDLVERWREESNAAWLYRVVSGAEKDASKARLFRLLAGAADQQAAIIEADMSVPPPAFRPSLRARLVAVIARVLSPRRILPLLAAMKVRGLAVYAEVPIEPGHPMPILASDVGARHRHLGGGAVRAAVFGVNDGLVSNTALIMGVAGATAETGVILLTGTAGLIAGAASMAAGEYVSMRSQRELFEYQIAQERDELERYPEEEAEELALVYNARGVPMEQARAMARRIIEKPEQALDTLAREELGLNPDDLGSPWAAAIFSFLAFAAGAVLPLLPFFAGLSGSHAIVIAAGLSAVALFAVGATISLFSGRGAVQGGARMLAIGAGAGALTFLIGGLLGVQIS